MASPLDAEFIVDLFSAFGPVSVRRMFGGAGLFADGLMFGLVSEGVVYLKADSDGAAAFEREGCAPFRYGTKDGERTLGSYWRMPDRLYDDPDELAAWARAAFAAARKGASKGARPAAGPSRKKSSVKRKPRRRSS